MMAAKWEPGGEIERREIPRNVGNSSETVGWMCIARWMTV